MIKTLFLSVWLIFHPVHVTLTSIDYIPERDSLKVFVKMYLDDFLLDMSLRGDTTSGTVFSKENPGSRDNMENYLNNKLLLRINKRLVSGKLNNVEIVDNEVKLNIGYCKIRNPEIITVKNLIMTDLYGDQTNLIIVRINEFEEGIKLTSNITEQTFNLK